MDGIPEAPTCPPTKRVRNETNMTQIPRAFPLTAKEREFLDHLCCFRTEANLTTKLRAAGGWVRDKMLGLESNDIDIALDDMTGEQFASLFSKWRTEHGLCSSQFGVIRANPEKSKHLETATMVCDGLYLDFVNLRTEAYADGSRIPATMQFGTPEEDAYRRDFTINALFYNILDDVVEDFTGKGIDDLRDRILRTPLHPVVSFKDDPLRLIRGVRFAAVLGFRMSEDCCEGARDPEVLERLAHVVSRERIGQEIEKAFMYAPPSQTLKILDNETNALSAVFFIPEEVRRSKQRQSCTIRPTTKDTLKTEWWKLGFTLCEAVEACLTCVGPKTDYASSSFELQGTAVDAQELNKPLEKRISPNTPQLPAVPDICLAVCASVRRLLGFASLLYMLKDYIWKDRHNAKYPQNSIPYNLLCLSLKRKRADAQRVVDIQTGASLWFGPLRCVHSLPKTTEESPIFPSGLSVEETAHTLKIAHEKFCQNWRVILGVIIRQQKDFWRESLLLASVALRTPELWEDPVAPLPDGSASLLANFVTVLHPDLLEAALIRPLINGRELMQVLPGLPKGPKIKDVLDFQIYAQLADPSICVETLQNLLTKEFSEYVSMNGVELT